VSAGAPGSAGRSGATIRQIASLLTRALRPEGLTDIQNGWRFGNEHQLSSGRLKQARQWRRVESFALDLLPPMPLAGTLVVDVGANVGDFTAAVLAVEPRARVLAIEPVPATNATLAARFAGDSRVRVDAHAITSSSGTTAINVTENSVFASVLAPRDAIAAEYTAGTFVKDVVEVPAARLDDLVHEPVSVLKIDVQGSEAALLRGAERTLAQALAVLVEVTFVSHYEGDTPFPELHRMMQDLGWALRAMTRPHRGATGTALWADACYVPARSRAADERPATPDTAT
jgi:FkbM family methyltransferase